MAKKILDFLDLVADACIALAILVLFLCVLGLRFQLSPSLPYGLYWARPYDRDSVYSPASSMVDFCLWNVKHRTIGTCPDGHAAIEKPVLGRVGDTITLSPEGVALNGSLLPNTRPLPFDRDGKPLRPYPYGSYTVGRGELWVVSTYHPASYDSRYYGPIPISTVREEIRPLWTW